MAVLNGHYTVARAMAILPGSACPPSRSNVKFRIDGGVEMAIVGSRITATLVVMCTYLLPLVATAQGSTSGTAAGEPEGGQMSMRGDGKGEMHMQMDMLRADNQAPLGVMGGDMMMKGMWMLTYQFMRMEMDGNLIGTDSVSPEQIVTTVPNRFFGAPGQPPTLRVVPTKMTTDMHMVGAMYAPTDWLTLMGMVPYIKRSMDHVTFQGPVGTTRLGNFTTESSGIGDVKLMGLFRAWESVTHKVHLNAGLSLPTGSNR